MGMDAGKRQDAALRQTAKMHKHLPPISPGSTREAAVSPPPPKPLHQPPPLSSGAVAPTGHVALATMQLEIDQVLLQCKHGAAMLEDAGSRAAARIASATRTSRGAISTETEAGVSALSTLAARADAAVDRASKALAKTFR